MNHLSIFVPTFNSARYIDLILEYYVEIDVPVTIFVDTKSSDGTYSIAKQSGFDVRQIENPAACIDEKIGAISRQMLRCAQRHSSRQNRTASSSEAVFSLAAP